MNFVQHDMHGVEEQSLLVAPEEVEKAFRTLLELSEGEAPQADCGDTPERVARAWKEYHQAFANDPGLHLRPTWEDVGHDHALVLLKGIAFQSPCAQHDALMTGCASIAYLPKGKVVATSRLARVLYSFARRPQPLAHLGKKVAQAIWDNLEPQGVAVAITAQCGGAPIRVEGNCGVRIQTASTMGCFHLDPCSRNQSQRPVG
jgi:GTP cyclohydrolase I